MRSGDEGSPISALPARAAVDQDQRLRYLADVDPRLIDAAAPHVQGAAAGQGMLVEDRTGHIVAADPIGCELLGVSWAQLVGNTAMDPRWQAVGVDGLPIPPEVRPAAMALTTGRPTAGLMGVLIPAYRRTSWLEVDARPLFAGSGAGPDDSAPVASLLGVVVLFGDVSQSPAGRQGYDALVHGYRLLAENASDLVFQIDQNGRIEWASPTATLIARSDGDEFIGREFVSLCHPDDVTVANRHRELLAQTGEEQSFEIRLAQPDGSSRTVAVTLRYLTNAAPGRPGIVAAIRDIDEVARSRAMAREMADHFPGLLGFWDRDLRCGFANQAYLEWFGLTPAETVGRHLKEVLGSELFALAVPHTQAALAGHTQVFERTVTKPSGEVGHVLTTYKPFIDRGSVRGFFASVTDVSVLKRAQSRLELANDELAQARVRAEASSALFGALFDNSPDGVLLLDPHGVVARANPAATIIFRRDHEVLVGSRYEELIPAAQDDVALHSVVRADGSALAVDVRIGRLPDLPEVETIITVRDMSQLSARGEALARSNAELQQFANVASHDLQEPLRKIASFVEILEADYGDRLDDTAKGYIRSAADGARRLRGLIDDLLTVSRIRTELMNVEPCDTGLLVRSVVEDLTLEPDAEIDIGQLPVLIGDRVQLRQLFHNLMSNAVKYRSRRPLRVSVRATDTPEGWHLTVQDNGIGFKQDYADQIFGMFQRLVSRTEYPGSGIGLAIVAKVVANHAGRVWVTSEPDVGTSFELVLPQRWPDAAMADIVSVPIGQGSA